MQGVTGTECSPRCYGPAVQCEILLKMQHTTEHPPTPCHARYGLHAYALQIRLAVCLLIVVDVFGSKCNSKILSSKTTNLNIWTVEITYFYMLLIRETYYCLQTDELRAVAVLCIMFIS